MGLQEMLLQMGAVPQGQTPMVNINGEVGNASTDRLSNLLRTLQQDNFKKEQEEQKRMEKLKNQASLFTTLREAGYSPEAAYKSIMNNQGNLPNEVAGETLKEQAISSRTLSSDNERKRLDLAKNREDRLSKDREVYKVNPITGEVTKTGEIPSQGVIYRGVMSPEVLKERAIAEGEGKSITKDIEMTSKLTGAVKRLAILNKQFNEAIPSGDNSPLQQRISGSLQAWAVKNGLSDNPKLLALQKNLRPIAINMIRMFGEVGNLSEPEQKGALDVVRQEGLTDAERLESTKQFIEYALAGARPESIKLIKDRKDIADILKFFNVDLNSWQEDFQDGGATNKNNQNGRFLVEEQ